MVQSQVVCSTVSTTCHQKPREATKTVKNPKNSSKSKNSRDSQHSAAKPASLVQKKDNEVTKPSETEKETQEETAVVFIPLVEEIKQRRREERLAKEKQAEEERERFVKEATERKAAERAEIVKQAKRLILYRKPFCRKINQALLVSECFRELDAQLKFRETVRNMDKEQEMAYVKLMRADVAKFEEEEKQKAEKQLKKQMNYADTLKKQIEEHQRSTETQEKEEFEAEKQDQINTDKYLQDMKEHEMQELWNKKQKLKQFFRDAIEEKKQFDLKLKHEDEFEDRAIEIYQNAKMRIKKLHKGLALKEKEERERRAQLITDQHRAIMTSSLEQEEQIFQKARKEQEANYQENQKAKKEREDRLRKELQDYYSEAAVTRSVQLQEQKDLKAWEMMHRFKKAEQDKELEIEEQKRKWNEKMEYATALKQYMIENDAKREEERILADDTILTKEIIEKENQRVLTYAEEVLNESTGVRPLYPIVKAIQVCKKEMGLEPLKKRDEVVTDTVPKRRRRGPLKCTKFVPEDKILYL